MKAISEGAAPSLPLLLPLFTLSPVFPFDDKKSNVLEKNIIPSQYDWKKEKL